MYRFRTIRPALMVGLALSIVLALPGAAASGHATAFSGQATVVNATVLGTTTVISDTGPLPASGGALETSLLSANVPGLITADVLHATAVGQGDNSRAEASVADVNLTVGGNTITASLLMARARASCPGPTVSGGSHIAELVINGQPITVTGQPNQTVPLIVGEAVINEQSSSVSGNTGTITVNALHVKISGVADVVISSAEADIACGGGGPPSNDFVTGGGFITGTPSGAKGNFGVAGGIKNGALWGHLTYIDHRPNGPKVRGTGVTAYVVVNTTTRHIEGTAEVNGVAGYTYQVDVSDNGEPGSTDSFRITLSNGYSASGALRGGNIQLHTK